MGAQAHLKEGYPCGLTKLPSLEGQMLHGPDLDHMIRT